MINLIKSDIYRLLRSKTYKVCGIASLGIICFVLGITIFTDVELWLMAFTGQDGIRRGFLIGFDNVISFKELIVNALGSGAGIYIIAISLTSSIIISNKRSGIMKNTVTYGYERWKIYLSQLISLIVGIGTIISITFIFILLITYGIYRPDDIGGYVILAIKSLIIYIMIVSTTVSVYMFFATLIPNSEVLSIIAIGEMLGLAMIGPSLPTVINNWIPYSMIRILAQVPQDVNFMVYLLNPIVISAIVTTLGILIFNRKEIK